MSLTGRRPLIEVQKAGSSSENEMVGRQVKKGKNPESPAKNGTPKNAMSKVKSGLVSKKKVKVLTTREVQTDNGDDSIVTGEEAPLEYWKELAETRRQALEQALEENYGLHKKIEELEKEKELLEEMVEQAKTLAGMLEDLSDEDPDESGIGLSGSKQTDDSVLEKDGD